MGDFVGPGDPLVRVFGVATPVADAALHGCVAVGAERTMEQDPRFAFRILVDIANKALSPAINDPTTAVLGRWTRSTTSSSSTSAGGRLDEGAARDRRAARSGVVYGTPDWPDFVMLAASEVRHYGGGSIQIDRRLRAMLEHLDPRFPGGCRRLAAGGGTGPARLRRRRKRGFQDEADRKRAGGDRRTTRGSAGRILRNRKKQPAWCESAAVDGVPRDLSASSRSWSSS